MLLKIYLYSFKDIYSYMSIKIGEVEIPQKYGANILPYMGGVQVKVSVLGEQPILRDLDRLSEGEIYEFESYQLNGILKIKERIKKINQIGSKTVYEYIFDFERI